MAVIFVQIWCQTSLTPAGLRIVSGSGFSVFHPCPSENRKTKQNPSNPESYKENDILKDGLGPDQEMLSYPIKFSKENIFIDTALALHREFM